MHPPIPVLCDRCRAEGFGGAEPFADLGDLLEFEPVPRRPRADGWTPELQRAFIAALAVTGSDRQAARAVGKAQFGVDQLKKARGNEGFMAAHAKAMAMAADDRSRRLAAGLHAVTEQAAFWRPPDPAWSKASTRQIPPAPEPVPPAQELDDDALLAAAGPKLEVLDGFFRHYLQRLEMEREARLGGRIVEADFYVRQVTFMEVMLDLLSGDGWAWLDRQRFEGDEGHRLLPIEIAETPLSRLLDETRRACWAESGEPERPPLPPPEQLADHGRYKSGLQDPIRGGPDWREQELAIKARHEEAARVQIQWEEKARREAAEWRARVEAEEDPPRAGDEQARHAPGMAADVRGTPAPAPDHSKDGGGGGAAA